MMLNLPARSTSASSTRTTSVRFYSEGERIFPRSPGVIGRKVQNCHPPASVAQGAGDRRRLPRRREGRRRVLDRDGRQVPAHPLPRPARRRRRVSRRPWRWCRTRRTSVPSKGSAGWSTGDRLEARRRVASSGDDLQPGPRGAKPRTVTRPTHGRWPPSSKASGIIVSASIVRIAAGGERLDDADGLVRHIAGERRTRAPAATADAAQTIAHNARIARA